jgi:hypothetical protein
MNTIKLTFKKINRISNKFRYFSNTTFTNPSKYNESYPTRQESDMDVYKREPVESDNNLERFKKKFQKDKYDVENEKWTDDNDIHGRDLYYPKYGTSHYESQQYKL